MQEEAKLSLKVFVMERLLVSGLGGITDKEGVSPLERVAELYAYR